MATDTQRAKPRARRIAVFVTDRSGPCQVGTWLTPASFEALDAVCRREDVSRAALVRRLIEQYITDYYNKSTGG